MHVNIVCANGAVHMNMINIQTINGFWKKKNKKILLRSNGVLKMHELWYRNNLYTYSSLWIKTVYIYLYIVWKYIWRMQIQNIVDSI